MSGKRGGRRRRSAGLVCALAVGLVLGACDGGEEPSDPVTTDDVVTTEPAETTVTSEESSVDIPPPPELDQPVPPEAMLTDDRAGAAAAMEYFFELVRYAQTTGDTRALEAMSGEECNSCAAAIQGVNDLHAASGWIEGSSPTLSDVVVAYPEGDDPNYYVGFTFTSPEGARHEGDGSVTTLEAAELPGSAALVAWQGARFIVNAVQLSDG